MQSNPWGQDPSVGAGTEALMEASRPDIYRSNAFRVTGLPVDATARTMRRETERLRLMQKFMGEGNPRSSDFGPAPDPYEVREALQRLRDPEQRLIHELFWFWPQRFGDGQTDEALRLITEQDLQGAARLWVDAERQTSDASVATHNLAILAHATALDLEYAGADETLDEDSAAQRDRSWDQALWRWLRVFEQEAFWSRLANRIRDLDDPRLTTGVTRRLRDMLPLSLLAINAKLAVQAAERGHKEDVSRHLAYLTESDFGDDAVEKALQIALERTKTRLRDIVKRAAEDEESDHAHAHEVGGRLLSQARPLLDVMDALLPVDHPTRYWAHDEVALTALTCQIDHGNETEDWVGSLTLLDDILPLAVGTVARDRIERNHEIVTANAEHGLTYGKCWFCSVGEPQEDSPVEAKLYGDVNETYDPYMTTTRVTWRHTTINVPRCQRCKDVHEGASNSAVAAGAVAAVAGMGCCSGIVSAGDGAGASWFWGIVLVVVLCGGGAGIVHEWAMSRARERHGIEIKGAGQHTEFPGVKELVDKGWSMGEGPETS